MNPMEMMMLLQAGMGLFNSLNSNSSQSGNSGGQSGVSQSLVSGAGKDSGGSAIPNLLGGGGGGGGIAGGALTGASLGSFGGPLGIGIGALAGGALGAFGGGGSKKPKQPKIYPIGTKENPGYVNVHGGSNGTLTPNQIYGDKGPPQYADQGAMSALLGSQLLGQGAQVGQGIGDMIKKRTPTSAGDSPMVSGAAMPNTMIGGLSNPNAGMLGSYF